MSRGSWARVGGGMEVGREVRMRSDERRGGEASAKGRAASIQKRLASMLWLANTLTPGSHTTTSPLRTPQSIKPAQNGRKGTDLRGAKTSLRLRLRLESQSLLSGILLPALLLLLLLLLPGLDSRDRWARGSSLRPSSRPPGGPAALAGGGSVPAGILVPLSPIVTGQTPPHTRSTRDF